MTVETGDAAGLAEMFNPTRNAAAACNRAKPCQACRVPVDGGHDHEARVPVAGRVQRIEASGGERFKDRADGDQSQPLRARSSRTLPNAIRVEASRSGATSMVGTGRAMSSHRRGPEAKKATRPRRCRIVDGGEGLPFFALCHAPVGLPVCHLRPGRQPAAVVLVPGNRRAAALDRMGEKAARSALGHSAKVPDIISTQLPPRFAFDAIIRPFGAPVPQGVGWRQSCAIEAKEVMATPRRTEPVKTSRSSASLVRMGRSAPLDTRGRSASSPAAGCPSGPAWHRSAKGMRLDRHPVLGPQRREMEPGHDRDHRGRECLMPADPDPVDLGPDMVGLSTIAGITKADLWCTGSATRPKLCAGPWTHRRWRCLRGSIP